MINAQLLDLLRCPFHPEGPPLMLQGALLICQVDGIGFRIVDGIPDMLPEDAVTAERVQRELQEQN